MSTKEHALPSGATLTVQVSPFADSKALFQAMLRELRGVTVSSHKEFFELFKDLVCSGFSSPAVEACMNKCMERCLYNSLKIDSDTFEPAERRGDYIIVCMKVIEANTEPFMKSLYAPFQEFLGKIEKFQA